MGRIQRNDGREILDLGFGGISASRAAVAAACVKAGNGWLILLRRRVFVRGETTSSGWWKVGHDACVGQADPSPLQRAGRSA